MKTETMKSIFTFCFLIAHVSILAQESFTALSGPPPGGRISSLKIDAATGKIYASSSYEPKIMVSDDNGATWERLGPASYRFNDVVIDGSKLYASDYSTFYVSEDGGTTWTRKNGNTPF